MTEQEAINALLEALNQENPPSAKTRVFRVLYFISFVLIPTVGGAIIGVPLFLILLIVQYILEGSINPRFYFYGANPIYAQRFIQVCSLAWIICVAGAIFIVLGGKATGIDVLVMIGAAIAYAVYIRVLKFILVGI